MSAILGKIALTTIQIALGFALCDFPVSVQPNFTLIYAIYLYLFRGIVSYNYVGSLKFTGSTLKLHKSTSKMQDVDFEIVPD